MACRSKVRVSARPEAEIVRDQTGRTRVEARFDAALTHEGTVAEPATVQCEAFEVMQAQIAGA